MNRFQEAREREGYVRCVDCQRIGHKDGYWKCESYGCDTYSCTTCDAVRNGFDGRFCEECRKYNNSFSEAERDSSAHLAHIHYTNMRGQ